MNGSSSDFGTPSIEVYYRHLLTLPFCYSALSKGLKVVHITNWI